MLFASLLLRAPLVVIAASTTTRLLWDTLHSASIRSPSFVIFQGGGARDEVARQIVRTAGKDDRQFATKSPKFNSTTSTDHSASTNKTNRSTAPKVAPKSNSTAQHSTSTRSNTTTTSKVAASHAHKNSNNQDDSFRIESLDLSVPISCGKKKCLFPVKADPTIGYLVSASEESKIKKMRVAWLYAKHLELHYKAQHLYLEEPRETRLSSEFANRLNGANLTRLEVNGESGEAPSFVNKGLIQTQKVRVAPKSSILVGCGRKYDHAVERLSEFVSSIDDGKKKSFVNNLEKQVTIMRNVLRIQENQCLLRDFQVLLDTRGNIHQIDLDRCPLGSKYKKGFKDHVKQCLAQFDDFVSRCKKAAMER